MAAAGYGPSDRGCWPADRSRRIYWQPVSRTGETQDAMCALLGVVRCVCQASFDVGDETLSCLRCDGVSGRRGDLLLLGRCGDTHYAPVEVEKPT